ncbi:MAG: hypothetical protein JST84_05170 [Acidobacteria bacterium]|nr:hypothetical protein [Acidobacteriota bacterium]
MTPYKLEYRLEFGTIFNANGIGINQLAIAFHAHDGTLFKHGEAALVEAWSHQARAKYQASNLNLFAEALTVITFATASPNVIAFANFAILHTGWIARAWQRIQYAQQHLSLSDEEVLAIALQIK